MDNQMCIICTAQIMPLFHVCRNFSKLFTIHTLYVDDTLSETPILSHLHVKPSIRSMEVVVDSGTGFLSQKVL